jgi:predicted PurR-regulated permease PerM
MKVQEQLRWWGAGTAAFIVLLWFLAGMLLPFVLGAALAYLTDPIADRLERAGLSRILATILITVSSMGLAVLALLLIIPLLVDQVQRAVAGAPAYLEQMRDFVATRLPSLADQDSALRSGLDALRERAQGWSLVVLERLWGGSLAVIDFLSLMVITPVVAFYLLLDWDRMIAWIDGCLPRQHRDTVHRLMGDLDRVLAGFVRGQLIVCTILGWFYGTALSIIGLEFGFLIGAFAGLISFVPFVGSILGGVLSVGVAVAQFWSEPQMIAVVAGVFAFGQVVEGNFLTPKLVGTRVGLHPVWLIFALSAFGSLFGFVGLLIAVPAAAGIGVFGRFLIEKYKESRLFIGPRPRRAAKPKADPDAGDIPQP